MKLISVGQEKARKKRAEKKLLTENLRTLIHAENQTPGCFGNDIKECKSMLLSKLEEEYRGAMIRCRVRTLERDEEPAKTFKTKERERATKNKIKALRVGEVFVTCQEDIERALIKFYEELFQIKRNSNDHL